MRIALVAGETSGDALGAALIEGLRRRFPGAQFAGVAGPRMRAAGCEAWYESESLSVMGLTEVIAHLVTDEMKSGKTPVEAVKAALPRLRGAFALAFLFAGEENLLIGARKGSPLAIGHGSGEMFLGSDAIALAPFTDTISYLEDGDWAVIKRGGVQVRDAQNRPVNRQMIKTTGAAFLVDKGNHRHFMAKEIHEQP